MRLKGQQSDLYICEFVKQIDWNDVGQFIGSPPKIYKCDLIHQGPKACWIYYFIHCIKHVT